MTLDLIVWVPETFVLLCLLVLLWYGSGVTISPVVEGIYYLDTKISLKGQGRSISLDPGATHQRSAPGSDVYTVTTTLPTGPTENSRLAGPLHLSSHLNSWAITVCFLMALSVWYTPLHSLQTGGLFLRDLFVTEF